MKISGNGPDLLPHLPPRKQARRCLWSEINWLSDKGIAEIHGIRISESLVTRSSNESLSDATISLRLTRRRRFRMDCGWPRPRSPAERLKFPPEKSAVSAPQLL
jgi:hypothetical protein